MISVAIERFLLSPTFSALFLAKSLMSLGKFTASVLSGTQETTVALAALNFDFALFKTEAPKEYKALGSALSPYRREVAEDGDIHTTARKLRAIFEQILPPTPSLYSAYGIRASEIASSTSKESRTTVTSGAFAAHQGIDGGSIWAAATSGAGAVAIHLLACMLARLWSSSEATSIWEEIVLRRKEQLSALNGSDPQNVFAAWAARASLTRQQLANWDASARAWLRAGDDTNRIRQRQLKLIIENIDIPVSSKSNVYDSVISAWTSAMNALNKLIDGMPHSIEDSSILLALSAWHLYPDMSVLSTSNHFIRQNDPLIDPRGILTLGLQSAQSAVALQQNREGDVTGTSAGKGITWSLPLAYYRFYGDPVRKEKALNTDGSRISVVQLLHIALGCIFHGWRETGFNVKQAAELLRDLWTICTEDKGLKNKVVYYNLSNKSWLACLADAAKHYLASDDVSQIEYARLFNYGRRRCPEFLGVTQKSLSSIVALQQPQNLLNLIASPEGRIRLLRRKAMRLGCDPRSLIIHYALPASQRGETAFAIATVVPTRTGATENDKSHKRWMTEKNPKAGPKGPCEEEADGEMYETLGKADLLGPMHNGQNGYRIFWSNSPAEFSDQKMVTSPVDNIFGVFAEMVLLREKAQKAKPTVLTGVPFEFVFGDTATAAIYRILDEERPAPQVFSSEDIRTAMAQNSVDISQSGLIRHLGEISKTLPKSSTLDKRILSLKVLCTIVNMHEHLSDASIAMTLTSSRLHDVRWMPNTDLKASVTNTKSRYGSIPIRKYRTSHPEVPSLPHVAVFQAFEPLELDLASSFACIAMLESGNIDLVSAGLQSVMAMSSGDSLYIATPLLSDPACRPDSKITRIRGNIGRAGIALLIPPNEPKTRDIDPKDWNLINHDEFDGVITDSFQSTSLHMSFTEFVLPVDTGLRGFRDAEVYFLETVISVHDKGHWMGDLNILPVLQDPLFRIITEKNSTCKHTQKTNVPSAEELISIDSWYEFLDRPEGPVVFRAHGNWMARLAAVSMSVVKNNLTLVFGENICWTCGEIEHHHLGHKKRPIFIL